MYIHAHTHKKKHTKLQPHFQISWDVVQKVIKINECNDENILN